MIDDAIETIDKYKTILLSNTGKKFYKFIELRYEKIKEIILDKHLNVSDKFELFRIKVKQSI